MTNSVVYVIGAASLTAVKIGVSTNLPERLRALQTGAPARLSVLWQTPGDRALEGRLHARLHEFRTYGEWFDLRPLGVPVDVVQRAVSEIRAGNLIGRVAASAPARYCDDPEYGGMRIHVAAGEQSQDPPRQWSERFPVLPDAAA